MKNQQRHMVNRMRIPRFTTAMNIAVQLVICANVMLSYQLVILIS